VAKGVGILLVIYGHAAGGVRDAGLTPNGGWIANSFYFLYTFHMPMFMFLAGILVENRLSRGRLRFFRSLGTSIVLPYFIWAPITVLVLSLTSAVTTGGESGGIARSIVAMFWNPPGWLWFFYGLFLCHLVAILAPFGKYALLLIGLALLPLNTMLHLIPVLTVTSYMFIFYALGVVIGPKLTERPFTPPVLLLVALAILFAVFGWMAMRANATAWSLNALPAAVTGAALMIGVSASPLLRSNRVLSYVGKRSMAIFVLHVFFVAGTRIAFDKILHYPNAAVILPVSVAAGLIGPLVIYEVASRLKISEWVGLGKPIPWAGRASSAAPASAASI